jgi:reactive intermediate/imine deaminase
MSSITTSLCAFGVASLIPVTGNARGADDYRLYVPVPNVPAPAFSEGVATGGVFYIAGHIGRDPATNRVPADAEAEARMVMDGVQQTLNSAGLTWEDVVSVTVYCTDLALYDRFNQVYRGYFHGPYPARAMLGVKDLLFGAHFEIAGVAKVSSHAK